MLTSPLWLRDKEPIPNFQVLPKELERREASIGEEMFVDENGDMEACTDTNPSIYNALFLMKNNE